MHFKSDNTACIHPKILKFIQKANIDHANSYGGDKYSQQLQNKLNEFFEIDVEFYITSTGTAANSLALSAITPPYGAVYCAGCSHIQTDEAGAPELFTNGAKLCSVSGSDSKFSIEKAIEHISHAELYRPHSQKPSAIALSSPTEMGLVYSLSELAAIHDFASEYNLPIHLDGARFANSLIKLDATPAELTWKNGIDVLSFGGTKNGALAAEMIVFFNKKLAHEFDYRHKRAGQLFSKMRYFSAQWLAYLDEDVWKINSQIANNMAQKLADIFRQHDDIQLAYEPDVNMIFVKMAKPLANYLSNKGAGFYGIGNDTYRFVTNWQATIEEINAFEELIKAYQPI